MHVLTKILKKVFNRTVVCILGIIIQVTYLIFIFLTFGTLYTYSYLIFLGAGAALSLYIYNTDINPTYKMAWMFVILSFPIFGVMFFIFFGNIHSGDRIRKRMMQYNDEARLLLPQDNKIINRLHWDNYAAEKQAKYLYNYAGYPVFTNTSTKYFPGGEEKFSEMIEQLEKARRFIFLEYFIIDEGLMWGELLEVLAEKARKGVEVRVMYDGTCEFSLLPRNYPQKLKELGINCKVFAPLTPFLSTHYNYRDHRKIVVIDGKVAFTGGVNLADEYINEIERFGHWKDTAIMVRGEAVRSFTMLFLQMWNITEYKPDFGVYVDQPGGMIPEAKGYVIPYGDCPLSSEKLGERVYLDILNRATEYVHIMTPYLVLDGVMQTALEFAAERGVDVKLILPGIPDKKAAYALAKTNYRRLLDSGVKIYEYTPGCVHAKVFVSDSREAVVGTINLDYRSLYHHFECAAYMYDTNCIPHIEEDFQQTLDKCRRVTYESIRKEKLITKLTGFVMKAIAPLI